MFDFIAFILLFGFVGLVVWFWVVPFIRSAREREMKRQGLLLSQLDRMERSSDLDSEAIKQAARERHERKRAKKRPRRRPPD